MGREAVHENAESLLRALRQVEKDPPLARDDALAPACAVEPVFADSDSELASVTDCRIE